jgi:hypothetical protein
MNCIDYLTKNNIKWFPINLQNKVLLPIKDALYNYTLPTFNDFIDLSDTQIKKRQTLITQFDYIAIDTNDIHMIDFDSIEATNKYNHLLDMPNFKSITKRLPHIFCKFEGDIKQKIQKIKKDNIDYDLLHGQWSYCHKDTIIDNHDKPIKHISFDIFDELKKDVKKEETKHISKEIKQYIELGLKHKIFEKMTGLNTWHNLGFLLKNLDDGEEYFIKLSKHHDKFNEIKVRGVYNCLGESIKKPKKEFTIKQLLSLYKSTDNELFKEIKTDYSKLNKPINNILFDQKFLDKFDSAYMNSFSYEYIAQKEYFELFICKVLRPEPQFIYSEGFKDFGKKSCIFTEKHIKTAFRHIITEKDDEETNFINVWLNDPNILCYNEMDFIPCNSTIQKQDNKELFNLFTGYNPKILSSYNKDNTDKILYPFIELGVELAGGDKDHFKYLMQYLAHMIQKPNERIPIAFIIKGKQGTGKNVFLNAIGNIIGKDHYITSSNPKDFFGDYAEGFYHKLLVNMNECEGKDTFDFEGRIKSFITEDTITINPKMVRPTQIRNVARVMIFTNKPNPIPIDVKSTDRRYVVFQTTDKFLDKKYGTKFWTNLIAHFNKPEFIACLYDCLNNMNIDNIDWKTKRPITNAYREMCKLYSPIEALFFEYYIQFLKSGFIDEAFDENEEQKTKLNKIIYDEYVKFCKSHGFTNDKSYCVSISKFNNRCTELEIPFKLVKMNGYQYFRFTPKLVIEHLKFKKWINRDEDDPEIVIEDTEGEDINFEV